MPGSPATTTDGRTTGTTCGGGLQSRSSTASSRTRQHDHHHHEPTCPSVTSTRGPEGLVRSEFLQLVLRWLWDRHWHRLPAVIGGPVPIRMISLVEHGRTQVDGLGDSADDAGEGEG